MTSITGHPLRVLLLRHAHAAWALPGMRDFDRPLDQRGREEVESLAATMSVNALQPGLVYCSSAKRCVETLDLLIARLGISPTVEHTGALYCETHEAYLDLIESDRARENGSIMIVGHNPMIEDTALSLLLRDREGTEDALESGIPTAGLFIADCSTDPDASTSGQTRFMGLLSPLDA
ncbi:MAG: histidine phosphatase family protein [Hoeflea sp.]|uniref:SixA phosphatase family protein n=1 Tax=Hoeflea sp. TaxID=1940281 RepID=UPI0032EF303D